MILLKLSIADILQPNSTTSNIDRITLTGVSVLKTGSFSLYERITTKFSHFLYYYI